MTDYEDSLARQVDLVNKKIKNPNQNNTLVFTEHNSVFTIGSRTNAINNLIWDKSLLKKNNISLIKTNRGGDITYHGPGQLIIYPIIKLSKKDLHYYLRKLEQLVINVLRYFDINSVRRLGKTGIWVGNKKICAIGVSVKSWTTYHGLALNISPDLSYYKGIVPCGITDGSITSMEEEKKIIPKKKDIKDRFIIEFRSIINDI